MYSCDRKIICNYLHHRFKCTTLFFHHTFNISLIFTQPFCPSLIFLTYKQTLIKKLHIHVHICSCERRNWPFSFSLTLLRGWQAEVKNSLQCLLWPGEQVINLSGHKWFRPSCAGKRVHAWMQRECRRMLFHNSYFHRYQVSVMHVKGLVHRSFVTSI